MNIYIDGKEQDSPRKDEATGAAIMIAYQHSEIHKGSAFKVDINTDDLIAEGDNDALHIKFVTPNTSNFSHLIYEIWSSGDSSFSLIEAPTGGATGGDSSVPINRNRNSSTVSTVTVTTDDTAPTGGTEIHHGVLGSGKNKIDSASGDRNELIMKSNTIYSLRLTTGTADIRAQMTANWYEHANVK